MILGLTGGIGCGKSTAGRFFEEMGFRRIDCDAVVKDEVLVRPDVIAAVSAHFGAEVIRDGAIDRARLASKVFGQPAELRWLEQLVHPLVSQLWRGRVAEAPQDPWLVEVPLLFEKGLEKGFDLVACVACSPSVQLARLELRGMTRTQAEQRIAQQLPLARKIELSDFVLSNDGNPEALRRQIALVADKLLRGLPIVGAAQT